MQRVYNFSAGPSVLPLSVLEQAQQDLLCYPGAGASVMEMSHRSKPFEEILAAAEASLRSIMDIPDDYAVLFLQGGASLQFSMVPMNLAQRDETVDYALTGQFAGKAIDAAKLWCNVNVVADTSGDHFTTIPNIMPEMLSSDAKYLHITANNTVFGTCFPSLPETGSLPIVCDMSSVILGRQYDVRNFGLIYAGAQKNMGIAGLTVVIVRRSLLARSIDPVIPEMLSYTALDLAGSMVNTPSTFSIYMAGLMFEWVKEQGGVAAMQQKNERKAALLYQAIDNSPIFSAPVRECDRSMMNVRFTLPDETANKEFLALCSERGLINLAGHRSAGGCRASIYNAMPLEGVQALVDCIHEFEALKRA